MSRPPRFGVITVIRNDLLGLKRTAESLHQQECRDYEWIVVDGASTDGTAAWLSTASLPGISWISEPDRGIYDGMNKGIARATAEYLVFMNAGDAFPEPGTLVRVARALDGAQPAPDLVFGGADLVFPNGRRFYRPPRPFATYIRHGLPAIHQATYYRRGALPSYPYDPDYRVCGDYYIVAGLFRRGARALHLDERLAVFTIGGTSYQRPLRLLREAARVQRTVLRLGRLPRWLSTVRRAINIAGTRLLAQSWMGSRGR